MERLRRQPSIVGSVGLAAAVLWVLVTNWDPVAKGHPSYLVFYPALLVLAVFLVWRWRSSERQPARFARSALVGLGLLLLAAVALWLSPFGADEVALDALEQDTGATVIDKATSIVFEPESESGLAVVFHPGARVDARAYASMMMPLAEAGHRVVIIKEPLGIAFLSFGFSRSEIGSRPDIDRWVVGGHSLGGVVASSDASSAQTDGLLLWASYPASDISGLPSLRVASIYGTSDRLTEPATVEASAANLPPPTTFTAVDGAIHAYFGDYGVQPGDGEPGVDRDTAQNEIIAASLLLLEAVRSS